MLSRISTEALVKTAVIGGAVTAISCTTMYYFIQNNLCSGAYFTEAVAVMKKNKDVCNYLGHPIKVKYLDLGSKDNIISPESAQVSIPVVGSKNSGVLKSCATATNGKWTLNSVTFYYRDKFVKLKMD